HEGGSGGEAFAVCDAGGFERRAGFAPASGAVAARASFAAFGARTSSRVSRLRFSLAPPPARSAYDVALEAPARRAMRPGLSVRLGPKKPSPLRPPPAEHAWPLHRARMHTASSDPAASDAAPRAYPEKNAHRAEAGRPGRCQADMPRTAADAAGRATRRTGQ